MDFSKLPTSLKYGSDCIICETAEIRGDVTLGNGTIVHPAARIIAEAGPIIIGEGNLIEERALIWNKADKNSSGSTPVMIIGALNVFEVYSHCEALKIGDGNIFEPKCFVGREVIVTDACVIGAGCRLVGSHILTRQTSVSGSSCQRIQTTTHASQALQMEILATTLPMYNKVLKKQKEMHPKQTAS